MLYKIAVDGPAGSGKSTISKIIANDNKIAFLNSGIFYRACAYLLSKQNANDEKAIEEVLSNAKIILINGQVSINGHLIDKELFTSENASLASKFSKLDIVRLFVNSLIREEANNKSIIMDGRDIGTVVFPDAQLKFFLTASLHERVNRRKKDFENQQETPSYLSLTKEIFLRDLRDKKRKNAPLKKASDAILIDTDNKTIAQVVKEMQKYIDEFLKCKE
ncbi:MAG: (d)CMP kinase [Mycoplasmoidaceae bacterium]